MLKRQRHACSLQLCVAAVTKTAAEPPGLVAAPRAASRDTARAAGAAPLRTSPLLRGWVGGHHRSLARHLAPKSFGSTTNQVAKTSVFSKRRRFPTKNVGGAAGGKPQHFPRSVHGRPYVFAIQTSQSPRQVACQSRRGRVFPRAAAAVH